MAEPSSAGPRPGGASAALCPHGKQGPCRFHGPRGGCKWGEDCYFCHVCPRVTAFNRIQQTLAGRRRLAAPAREAEPRPGLSFLAMLGACPGLLLEGMLGGALPAAALCALLSVHSTVAAVAAGEGALSLWRAQLRRLATSGLRVSTGLLGALGLPELRRSVRALGELRMKTTWHINLLSQLQAVVAAAEAARSDSPDGSTLFALTYIYHASPLQRAEIAAAEVRQGAAGGDEGPGGEAAATALWPEGHLQNEVESSEPASGSETEPIEDGDSDGEWILVQDGSGSQLVFPDSTGPQPICLPDGQLFRVVPVICTRSPETEGGPLQCALKPLIMGEVARQAQCDFNLWSASPSVCAFSGLTRLEELPLRGCEAAALLGRPSGRWVAPKPLWIVAAVRCRQRFWDMALR